MVGQERMPLSHTRLRRRLYPFHTSKCLMQSHTPEISSRTLNDITGEWAMTCVTSIPWKSSSHLIDRVVKIQEYHHYIEEN